MTLVEPSTAGPQGRAAAMFFSSRCPALSLTAVMATNHTLILPVEIFLYGS